MGTPANLDLLRAGGLLTQDAAGAGPDDLVIVVAADSTHEADEAIDRVDELMHPERSDTESEYRFRSLPAASKALPEANWVLVSVPGKWAADVAREALDLGSHVFLYSDNVPMERELELKRHAAARGLLLMGPDCGTAIVGGAGLGFANRVRKGGIGIIAASGTGLQSVASRVHELGEGLSQAIGTGGRDLSADIGGITALQALNLLADDPETQVIVLVSKPPDPAVAARLLTRARRAGKPVVVNFQGEAMPASKVGNLHFAPCLDEVAELAVDLVRRDALAPTQTSPNSRSEPPTPRRFLRGLFAGGTLAKEAQLMLRSFLRPLSANEPVPGVDPVTDLTKSRGHEILDLGADDFTVGRLHPMMDQDLRMRRMVQEAADPEVAILLLDVVLGDGSHPDPASELASVISRIVAQGEARIGVILVGTDADPQDLQRQASLLEEAGAEVFRSNTVAFEWVLDHISQEDAPGTDLPAVENFPGEPVAAINVGIETLYAALRSQDVPALQVDWKPPAGGNARLAAILERMKG